MKIGELLEDLMLARKIPERDSEKRTKTFTFNIKGEVDLPFLVWEYLVKARADFRCEDCGTTVTLKAHHLRPLEGGGKNTLRNGKCICISCVHRSENNINLKGKLHQALCRTYGTDKGTKMWEEMKKMKTRKEKEAILHSLLNDILPDKNL